MRNHAENRNDDPDDYQAYDRHSQPAVPSSTPGALWCLRSLTAAVFAGVALILVNGVSIELVHALRARSATKA
jgi:hypothetical protein